MDDQVLAKGANVSLLNRSDLDAARLQAVVRWSAPDGAAEVDVSALLLGADGLVRSDEDFVFYNAPEGGGGAVRLLGRRAEDDRAEDRVAVDLEALPAGVERVVIAASVDTTTCSGFAEVDDLGLVLLDATGATVVRFAVSGAGAETAIVLGEIYLRGEEWKFRAIGQGWESGLAGLATDFGITVDDAPEAASDEPAVDTAPEIPAEVPEVDDEVAAELVTAELVTAELVTAELVTAPPVEEPGEIVPAPDIADPAGGPDPDVANPDIADVTATVGAGAGGPRPAHAARRGVHTRRRRTTAATVAPLTLAVDPSWQPARLFSISGVGSTDEQEKRATSILLSTMMAVRDFGRAIVSRFGGPAGTIETYLESAAPTPSASTGGSCGGWACTTSPGRRFCTRPRCSSPTAASVTGCRRGCWRS